MTKEKEGQNLTKEQSYGYYSYMLQEQFDTLEALKEAEEKKKAELLEEEKAYQARKKDADEVKKAYQELLETKQQAATMIRDKEQAYLTKRDAFVNKYGSYHMTYCNKDGKEDITIASLVDDLFNSAFKLF